MFLYILVYILGVCTGLILWLINTRSVQRAVEAERQTAQKTINRLKQEADDAREQTYRLRRERDMKRAYHEGRKSPLSEVERLAETLESRGTKFVNTSRISSQRPDQ